jgi:hypothetical protein
MAVRLRSISQSLGDTLKNYSLMKTKSRRTLRRRDTGFCLRLESVPKNVSRFSASSSDELARIDQTLERNPTPHLQPPPRISNAASKLSFTWSLASHAWEMYLVQTVAIIARLMNAFHLGASRLSQACQMHLVQTVITRLPSVNYEIDGDHLHLPHYIWGIFCPTRIFPLYIY